MTCRVPALAVVALLGAGCGEAPVRRVVPLALQERLPRIESRVVGDRLRLVVRDLEPLREGTLFVWGRSGQSWTALGPLGPSEASTFTVEDPAGLEEVLVTQESAGTASSPSSRVIFRGRPGEELALGGYGGPDRSTLLLAQVGAELLDNRLILRSTGVPFVGPGLHYAVWMRREAAHGQAARALLLGRLGASGKDELEADELLAEFTTVGLTLELDAGDEAPGTELMTGRTLPEAAAVHQETAGHEH